MPIREWRRSWESLVCIGELFDYVFDSSEIQLRKPENAFYRFVQERTSFKGKEIVLIDDRLENVQAASDMGWSTILFSNADELKNSLENILKQPIIVN